MNCPKCESNDVHRSRRRGLYEGLALRLILRAPFRCVACGLRFTGFILGQHVRRPKKHRSLASYLGLHGVEKDTFNRILLISLVAALFILAVTWVVLRMSVPSPPPPPLPEP